MTLEEPNTRTRLLAHAREVYLEGGAAHFSLREVARRVGISAAAVYRHFDSKDALLGAVCEEGFRTFLVRRVHIEAQTQGVEYGVLVCVTLPDFWKNPVF